MRRFVRRLLGTALVVLGLAVVAGKLWLASSGPYLEALPPFPFCAEARAELGAGQAAEAIELAEAGGCEEELAAARAQWDRLGAMFERCVSGVWTGRAGDGVGITCAIASDLVVFGDVRDLTRQGIAWFRGEETDEVLVALSAAGIALTFTPQVGAGNDLLKAARRAGALSESLARSVVRLARERAWRPLANLFGDAGRISLKVGPARATRALAYADDADELARVARFVDAAPSPLLGLRWGGKGAARLADPDLYAAALARGPAGVELAVRRGTKALLARQPLVVALAKQLFNGNASALAVLLLRRLTWPVVVGVAAGLVLLGAATYRSGRRPRRRPRLRHAAA
ncbi:MAG TPA: hypothetical protein VFF08_08525 [Trueperaceae bacterium]|nr:hypothetical protein [Trueperaceae bacterium]